MASVIGLYAVQMSRVDVGDGEQERAPCVCARISLDSDLKIGYELRLVDVYGTERKKDVWSSRPRVSSKSCC